MYQRISFILGILIISQLTMGQNFKKAFKSLDDKNYTSARVIFAQAQKNPDTKSIGDYGTAVVQRNTRLRIEDMYNAFDNINNSKKTFADCNSKIKSKYKVYFNEEIIDSEYQTIDKLLFDMVKEQDAVESYDKHISKCQKSKYYMQAVDMRNAKAFAKAAEFNTINAYKRFIEKYPNSDEYIQAQKLMHDMAWDECVIYNNKTNYQDFIINYPNAHQAITAQSKIRKIDYKKAVGVNTQDAFDAFIAKYPNTEEANTLLSKGVIIAFTNVAKFKTMALCEDFLEQFPNTKYSSRVTIIRDSLAYKTVLQKNTPEDYSQFIENFPNAVQVPLVMEKMGTMLYSKEELQNKREKIVIKQQAISTIKIYDSKDTNNIIREKHFDKYGNCIYDYEKIHGNESEMKKYFYDDAGDKILKKQVFINDRIKLITKFDYNIKGLKTTATIKCSFNCLDKSVNQVDSFIYDDKRNLISKRTISTDSNNLLESHTYTYDVKGNRTEDKLMRISSLGYSSYTISYNHNGKGYLLQESTINQDGKPINVESLSYDGLDKVISSSRYNARGTLMRTFFYNRKGLVENEVHTYEDDDSKNQTRIWKYTSFEAIK